MKKKEKYNVAVVGVGAVGQEMLRVLDQHHFPIDNLKVLARRARDIEVGGKTYSVRPVTDEEFKGVDIALFAGTEGEKGAAVTYGKKAKDEGAVVIDNGADFRMEPEVPLVVPEVNPEDLSRHKGLIANPNCSTIQLVVALGPLHRLSRIKRIIVSTYQAVSGTGGGAIEVLKEESRAILAGDETPQFNLYPHRIAFNVIPHIGRFAELNYTQEEWKLVRETHKIFHDDKIAITATAVRVPIFNVHSESIYIETEKRITVEEARRVLSESPGLKMVDELDPVAPPDDDMRRTYPLPIDADGKDEVFVGRIREDPFIENGLSLWVVGDNLRKGAALNAVQIAEKLIE